MENPQSLLHPPLIEKCFDILYVKQLPTIKV